MRKPKENDQYVKAVEYSHTLEKFLIMERENCAALLDKLEAAERERDELRKTLKATQGGATEYIKNVMRLQEGISRLDKESQRLSDQLGACDRQRLDWLKRALTAEAEIARRDAAAGEPYGYVHKSLYEAVGSAGLSNDHEAYRDSPTHIALYTAAQPAVLLQCDIDRIVPAIDPEGLDEAKHYIEHALYVDRERIRSELKDLGAQQQKVVELHKRKSTEVISGQRYSYVLLEDLLPELDAANVKWEVKK